MKVDDFFDSGDFKIPKRHKNYIKGRVNKFRVLTFNSRYHIRNYSSSNKLEISFIYYSEIRKVLLDQNKHTILFEAVVYTGQALCSGIIENRYLNLYKAYECLEKKRKLKYRAIRHHFSHATSKLTDKKILRCYKSLFPPNISIYQFEKRFYRYLVDLMLEVDYLLYKTILSEYLNIKRKKYLTHDSHLVKFKKIKKRRLRIENKDTQLKIF